HQPLSGADREARSASVTPCDHDSRTTWDGPPGRPDHPRRTLGTARDAGRPPVVASGCTTQCRPGRFDRRPGPPPDRRSRRNTGGRTNVSAHPAVETTATIDNGKHGTRTIRFETGRLARQAAGSSAPYLDDETMILSATTASKNPKDQLDFFPLTVDVEERHYSIGKIPGSFFRREGRPSEDAILTCRLTDRPLRPSFAKGLRNEVQVVCTVMALNPNDLYD